VLLLDEPLGALDAKLRKYLQADLHALQREVGITFIYVTHDQEEALAIADRVGVMNAGRLEQLAPPAELYESPKTPFVGEFVGLSNRIPARVEGDVAHVLDAGLPLLPGSAIGAGVALVRPEAVSLVPAQDGQATVASISFLGPVSRVTVTMEDGALVVAQLASSAATRLSIGDRVRLQIESGPVLVVGA
jgi:putative spermidine/putrescine transport system ATP-binding protein